MIFENGETFFKNIFQVDPGSYISIDCNSFKIRKYDYYRVDEKLNPKAKMQTQIDKSLFSRLISDVKIGILLSGGLDSSYMLSRLIKKYLKKVNVFTAGNKSKKNDESIQAKETIKFLKNKHPNKNIKHKIFNLANNSVSEQLSRLSKYYDQPIHLSMSPLLFNICKNVSNSGYKVLYGGEGLDEIAYGYKRFFITMRQIKNNNNNLKSNINLIYFGSGLKNVQLISKILKKILRL